MTQSWYRVSNVAEIDSPVLMIYPDRVEENVRRMIAYAGGVERLRPHVKTHKMAEVIRLQLAAGITKFKCATVAEAEMVARAGGPDVMLAHQPVGPKAERFARLVAAFPNTRFSTIVDDEETIDRLWSALVRTGQTADVLVDIDVGMGRTGVAPGSVAFGLYQRIARLPGLEPAGLHVYDGHVRDRDRVRRAADCDAAFAPVEELRNTIERMGLPRPKVVAGGTPTFPIHARHPDRECSPGTCVFWDASYEGKYPDLKFLHAAVLLTRVISKPAANRLCLDLGYKAVASDNPDPRVALLDLPDARMLVHSEEHMTIETARAGDFAVGDALYGIPFHVCPTTALHADVIVVRDGVARERWPVSARDRRLSV